MDAHVRTAERLAGDRLGHDRPGDVDRDGEADAVAVRGDGGVDADDIAAGVEQRPARVARVDRRVGLDEVGQRLVVVGRDRAALGRHDAAGDRVRIGAQRAADRDDQLADLERVGLADRGRRQARGVDLDDREVGQGVDAVDGAGQDRGRP